MNINEVLLLRYVLEIGKNLRCEAFRRWGQGNFIVRLKSGFMLEKRSKTTHFIPNRYLRVSVGDLNLYNKISVVRLAKNQLQLSDKIIKFDMIFAEK